MNYRMILRLCGFCLMIEAAFMLLPVCYALYAGESPAPMLRSMAVVLLFGLPLALLARPRTHALYAREGWFSAGAIWLLISLGGALPFYFGELSDDFIHCLFESVSGFTTTNASILEDMDEHPRTLLMWRSLTSWLGGMGVLVFLLALLPGKEVDTRSIALLRAEAPGPTASKLVPKMSQTAKLLYVIYLCLTGVTALALLLAKMSPFDALIHAWSIAGTGGFSYRNESLAYYNSTAIHVICSVSMLLASLNFMLFFHLATRQFRAVYKDSELRFHLFTIVSSTAVIAWNLRRLFPGAGKALEHAFFQVSSLITSTGFSSANYDRWPTFSKMILLFLMVLGGCAGSTAGGLKSARVIILLKTGSREISRLLHPRMVRPVRLNGKPVDDAKVNQVLSFFMLYCCILFACALILSLDGLDLVSTFSAAVAALNNVGPGFGKVGPAGNYAAFSRPSLLTLSLAMLLGRLEIFPILILIAPNTLRMHYQEVVGVGGRSFAKLRRRLRRGA